jgi:hypothetical protein
MDIQALRTANPDHWNKAAAIRTLTLDAIAAANSGHSGMPMGMADVATVLFEKHMKFDAKNPTWPDRDRFILSAGHGSMLIYSLLHLCGYEDFPIERSRISASWVRKPRVTLKTFYPTRLKQQQAHWVRVFQMPLALPWPKKSCAPVLAKKLWITTPMSSQATGV